MRACLQIGRPINRVKRSVVSVDPSLAQTGTRSYGYDVADYAIGVGGGADFAFASPAPYLPIIPLLSATVERIPRRECFAVINVSYAYRIQNELTGGKG